MWLALVCMTAIVPAVCCAFVERHAQSAKDTQTDRRVCINVRKLRTGANGKTQAPGNAVTIQRLDYVRVKRSAHGRKVKTLVAIAEGDLVLRIEAVVVPDLRGGFAAADKGNVVVQSGRRSEITVEVDESVARGQRQRRSRREGLDNVRQPKVRDPWHLPSETPSPPVKTLLCPANALAPSKPVPMLPMPKL